jgi:hypothetical protein
MKIPKVLKVTYMGNPLKDIYPHSTKLEIIKYRFARGIRVLGIQAVIALALLTSNYIGQITVEPVKVYADREVVKEVRVKAPVMDRIAFCESSGQHIEKKTGQVVMRSNNNKTVDVGKYQLNSVWFKKASDLGLDITKEEDNEKMAYWIYENRGTSDWSASSQCWNR